MESFRGVKTLCNLPLNLRTWGAGNLVPIDKCTIDRGILSKKLVWKVSSPFRLRGIQEVPFSKWRFGGRSDKSFYGNLDVGLVSFLYRSNNYSNGVLHSRRNFSSLPSDLKSKFNVKSQKYENIFPLISSVENLQQAWYEIKSKPGNMTPGGDGIETLDGLEVGWFKKVSDKLNSGTYMYKSTRKAFINKPGKSTKRQLTIGSPRDKVVQKAILRVLQQIYEGVSTWESVDHESFKKFIDPDRSPYGAKSKRIRSVKGEKFYEVRSWILNPIFYKNSFGFRPNRSPHSALELIKKTWAPVVWFWSADIIEAFDKVNHNRLISEIEKTVYDPKLINELRKMLNINSNLGTSQGSVISPFLFNIYLTPLDNYIEKLITKHNKDGSSTLNPEFRSLTRSDQRKFKDLKFHERLKRAKFERDKAKAAGLNRTDIISEPIKINYVRFADDMLFGLNMNKPLAKIIINKVRTFIKSDLHLDCHTSSSKSKLSHGVSELTTFLGFKIGLYPSNYSSKSKHLTRFYKLKANIQRKKVMESEKYFKMQEQILAKTHRDVINSTSSIGQTLVKKSRIKEVYDHRVKIKVIQALKKSLSHIESEVLTSPLVSHFSKADRKNPEAPFTLAEQKRFNLLKLSTQKWIQKARDLATEDDSLELQHAVGEFLSPEFVKARETYLKELAKLSSRDFSGLAIEYRLRKAKSPQEKSSLLSSTTLNHRSIRILFPKDEFHKKLRSLGIINKIITRPTGVGFLTPLKDQDIVNWFSLKASGIWNYYSCADNIWDVKKTVNWILRYSLLGTLGMKHKSSIKQMIQLHTLAPSIKYTYESKGVTKTAIAAQYPTQEYYNKKAKTFNSSSMDPVELEKILRIKVNSLNAIAIMNSKCAVLNCENDSQEIHHVRNLGRRLRSGVISTSGSHVIQGWKGIESALNRKQVPLCTDCHHKIHSGKLSVDDLDPEFLFKIQKEV